MRVDLYNQDYRIEGVQNFAVRRGQQFFLYITGSPSELDAFSNNDEVLTIRQGVNTQAPQPMLFDLALNVTATADGKSTIQLQGPDGTKHFELNIEVFSDEAATLGLKASEPVLK